MSNRNRPELFYENTVEGRFMRRLNRFTAEVEIDGVALAGIEAVEDVGLRDAVGDAGAVGFAIAEEVAFEFVVGSFDIVLNGDVNRIARWDDIGRISGCGAGEEILGRVSNTRLGAEIIPQG